MNRNREKKNTKIRITLKHRGLITELEIEILIDN